MAKVEVNEDVYVAGAFGKDMSNMLTVHVTLSFDIPPASFTPGVKMMVERELQNSVTRLIEAARKKEKLT